MHQINWDNISSLYFVGIGGIAMSATAGLAKKAGYQVSGSDSKAVYSPSKEVLEKFEIKFSLGYDEANVAGKGIDLFILGAAESQNNPEVKWIIENEKPYISFPELLSFLAKDKIRIVVTGTHGKSTTSGMLGRVLQQVDDSSFMVGAVLQEIDSNFHGGEGNYFVFEGDEYKSTFDDPTPKFHYYRPDIVVLNNVEFDHPDVFENLEQILSEFKELIVALPGDGLLVYNADDANASKLAYDAAVPHFSFSIEGVSNIQAQDIQYLPDRTLFSVRDSLNNSPVKEEYELSLPGKHNLYNTLGVIATLKALGFSRDLIAPFILSYKGVKRRFEIIQEKPVVVIDDYAHHPTAVRETLAAAKSRYPNSKIWAVYEPHTFSRTEAIKEELATSFADADEVLLAEIYSAREKSENFSITSSQVLEMLKTHNPNARLISGLDQAKTILESECSPGDVVVIMAVGSFNKLASEVNFGGII